MIKISALNEASEEDSDSEEEVTKEALEQIALQQYAKALELQRKGNLRDATQLLKDLLDTELLYNVQKPPPGEKVSGPLFNLKYLCYKNLAAILILSEASEVDSAIEAYRAASELDDTDVTLWHRLGQLYLRAKRYEMALQAFRRGVERNPRHWPCLDKIITLLLGLDYKEDCISTIYEALELDPGYLRGLVYRKHIFTTYRYVKDYMQYLNPIYKWNEKDDDPIDKGQAETLLKEAEDIHETFLEQQKAEQFKCVMPNLKLKKSITKLTWESVGHSLVHMHHYMTENFYSHACYIELVFEKDDKNETMEIVEKPKKIDETENKTEENNTDNEKNAENMSENENNDLSDKDKVVTDNEKVESDIEMVVIESAAEIPQEAKIQKKTPVRRRGSAISFLEQWEWCQKRRSGRKKPVNRQDRYDDNIYDTLRRMVPTCLAPDIVQNKGNGENKETSLETMDIDKLFKENEQPEKMEIDEYFGTECEQKDVQQYINKNTQKKCDIIDMLREYLIILADKWKTKWPESLSKTFVEANKCYSSHIDVPSCTDNNREALLQYTTVNLLVEELLVNEKLNTNMEQKEIHDLSIIESIGMALTLKPHFFEGSVCLESLLRCLWVKLHINILNKCDEFALDCLYQLSYEFEAMGDFHDSYSLNVVNFTFKPLINEDEILAYIKFLERNKKLSTVMDLYDRGSFEEVLSIVVDSFENCKNMARNQEEEMSLDFAVQLSLILDTYWALGKVDECFKWSLVCLHEALKHYFRLTSGSSDYEKWTLTVVKILCAMEHILTTEGLSSLDAVSQTELSQGLEDLIRIIGHQVETNSTEMPLGTVSPWIIMHYILQREEDQGRGRIINEQEKPSCEDVANPLMVLFIAHEHLGNRGWCCIAEGKLLYFILDTVVPRLRSPSLSKSLETVTQYMEQCVYCLFGHPSKKNKIKYLVDHNVTPHQLDWNRAQQVYEIFRPPCLPALEGKVSGLTVDTEQLFHSILALLPAEFDPQKYVPEIEKYIKGIGNKLPSVPPLLPYKMKDIYFLLGDYYFKKEDGKMAIKFNMLDIIVNNDRLESWAEISLAKAVNLERILNSCRNINNEKEFLNLAKSIIRCFKRSLELDPTHCNLWIEYGIFVYTVHSFCSRLLKQASESLSMVDFEALERQKEDMLDTTQKCFTTVLEEFNNCIDTDKTNEEAWLHYYMLGKVAEKRNKSPSVYLDYYMKAVKSLQETEATYPSKINYSTPTHFCIEVLELHYRIHASILKYIEQHENKPIPSSVGKVFMTCIEEWKIGPFTRKSKKDGVSEPDNEVKQNEPVQAANIFKRSISDAGEEDTIEAKKLKLESAAAKVKRSASYDTERAIPKEPVIQSAPQTAENVKTVEKDISIEDNVIMIEEKEPIVACIEKIKTPEQQKIEEKLENVDKNAMDINQETDTDKKEDSSSSTSSSSSSDSSSSDSTSDSTSDSSRNSDTSSKSSNNSKPITEDEISSIVAACLDALEDCASRFPQHYKAIYRLAHYHFYYKKGKDIERCRDLMLSNFRSRSGQKLGGLFSERKHSNFFNNIWKIPSSEVDRAGGFAFHMNRSVLLTMEILKEIDDHKTLLDLSLQLQKIPDPGKTYLRESDREELAQQAVSLCVQSLKGQLLKFSQQADLKTNEIEQKAFKSLMLDIYRAYQRAQKVSNPKQFANLLMDAYKLINTPPTGENVSLLDLSLKYCHSVKQTLNQQATQASLDKSQNLQKKQAAKASENIKASTSATNQPKVDHKSSLNSASTSALPKMSPAEMTAAFQTYLSMLNDPMLSQQRSAALSLSYLSNISTMAGYSSLQNTLQSSLQSTLQNSFQAEFYRQFLEQSFSSSYNIPPPKKQKRALKPVPRPAPVNPSQAKPSKTTSTTSVTKSVMTPVITSTQKSSTLAPSMGTVLPSLPASMTGLSSFGAHTSHSQPAHAHMSSASTANAAIHTKPPMPHEQVSPGKTLQEKLAERQKHMPSISKSVSSTEINASISRLPSSLTITKTSVSKAAAVQGKKVETKKALSFNESDARPKPITSDEVIVLDDDD